jgi:hypothetical protein
MGIEQRLKPRLVARRHRVHGDLAKVQAQGLGSLGVDALYTTARGI